MSRISKDQSTPSFDNMPPRTSHLHLPLRQGYNNNQGATKNAEISSPLEFSLGIPLSHLKIGEYIGRGSYGTVRKGTWQRQGRHIDVAIKMFQSEEERESFLIEVRQLSCPQLRHPNIVRLYGASTENKPAYLVMEYAEGGSLYHLLHNNDCKKQPYDLRHACSWAMQTARGVAHLHNMKPKPIMHRDLKPANLLLFSRGKILKICDFGTACAVKTQMTNNTGSACYMAPEVMKLSNYQEKGDVFSWAVIFWEILARRTPHPQLENVYQVMWKVCEGGRPPFLIDCPKIIEDLICRSWDMSPNKRPSMEEVVKEIELIYSLTTPNNDIDEARTKTSSTQALDDNVADKLSRDDKSANLPFIPGSSRQSNDPFSYNQDVYSHSPMLDVARFGIRYNNNSHVFHQNEALSRQSQLSASKFDQHDEKKRNALSHRLNLLRTRRKELEEVSQKTRSPLDMIYVEYKMLKETTKLKKNVLNQLEGSRGDQK